MRRGLLILLSTAFGIGCGADPSLLSSSSSSDLSPELSAQAQLSASYSGTRVSFRSSDYYTLASPHPATSCAGDAKAFYDPYSYSSGSVKFPDNIIDPTTTLRPAFVKNVSVDLTDANTEQSSNLALSCSYGSGSGAPPVSQCASFDANILQGAQASLGGNFLIMGGTGSSSGKTIYALEAHADSTQSDRTSFWSNLSSSGNGVQPGPSYGGSLSYNSALQQVLFFGGTAPFEAFASDDLGVTRYDTWVYDVPTQQWTRLESNAVVNPSLQRTLDYSASTPATPYQLSKATGGRAVFGYASISGLAISQLSTNASMVGAGAAVVDLSERMVTLGGIGPCYNNACADLHTFNPTYGPEYSDASAAVNAIAGPGLPTAPYAVQWINSYPAQLMSNSEDSSLYRPSSFPGVYSTPKTAINFGLVGLNNLSSGSSGLGIQTISGSKYYPGTGYLVVAGGFYGYPGADGVRNTTATLDQQGHLGINVRRFSGGGWATAERTPSNFTSTTNWINSGGYRNTPSQWVAIADRGGANQTTPWYGGGVLLKGIRVNGTANQAVFFGGADCRDYLLTSSTCSWPTSKNPGRYWDFGTDPGSTFNTPSTYPDLITMGGTVPSNAGMAAARGADLSGNPLIVAWGGMSAAGVIDGSRKIHYLYNNNSGSETPTWGSYTAASGEGPVGLANASLVYSHVTGKFYLFGGYNSSYGTLGDTWELSISSTTPSCGKTSSASCVFQWRLLSPSGGLTCYPNCPQARRSHRMIEVNYNATEGAAEPTCSSSSPCSFGLFMEGGTRDGISSPNADRWLFDPTANSGSGHWQAMGEFPPRTFASMTSVDYYVPSKNGTVHRAILFGGETGLQGATSQFIPPTLGDTWMYDYDTHSWNRVALYGKRYPGAMASLNALNETESRAGSLITDTSTVLFSPPALAGAMMVTRIASKTNHLASDAPVPLKIPEVFLIGGRKKDGTFHLLNQVFKFCAGSTGEKPATTLNGTVMVAPDDASCDAYDETTNPKSPSPVSDYVGRWLYKRPIGTGLDTSQVGSFYGAATYDPTHDLVVVVGGLTPTSSHSTQVVTNSAGSTLSSAIYEYTPPSAVAGGAGSPAFEGHWDAVPVCSENTSTPVGRYGHSLAYDSLQKALVMIGGVGSTGTALTQSNTFDGTVYSIPEVWNAYRVDSALPEGRSDVGIPAITSGTYPCYYWKKVENFGSTLVGTSQSPPLSGVAFSASAAIPPTGYHTGYYTLFDNACVNSGPISSSDSSINRLLAGGAYIDIDRTRLGANENLVLHLTFIPLGPNNQAPDQSQLDSSHSAILNIHLVRTGIQADALRAIFQPRHFTFANTELFPQPAQKISIFTPANGQIRQEQVLIPLSLDPSIDRIRIERYSGSAILVDLSLYRLGHP